MAKTKGVRYWKAKAWTEFSRYIRTRDTVSHGHGICCTCNKPYPTFGVGCMQAGHYVAGRINAILFEEHGCHAQCYNCNINLKGNTLNYRLFMDDKYGRKERERIEQLRFKTIKFSPAEMEAIRDKYVEKRIALMAKRRNVKRSNTPN